MPHSLGLAPIVALTAGAWAAPALSAECPPASIELGARLLAPWRDRTPVAAPDVPDPATAACVQQAFAGGLGAPIGWKVGLTSAAAQEAFGVDQPVAGRLFEGMFLPDGATIDPAFGARPLAEADLVVTVRDAGVMAATTPLEALAHIDSLAPFIELPDLMVAPGEKLTADVVTAINVGARSGVMGAPIPVEATQASVDALAAMTVRATNAAGEPVGEFPGAAILGNQLNALLWLTAHLGAAGDSLAPGDVISLGGFGPPLDPAGLDTLTVSYAGLPGGIEPSVSVTFE